jgi:hypothetical protein
MVHLLCRVWRAVASIMSVVNQAAWGVSEGRLGCPA